MKHQPKITNTVSLTKLAKIDGAGRRSKYVAFSQLDTYTLPMVIGEVESVDGDYVKVIAIDNLETILVNKASTTLWYIEPAQAEKWKKDIKRGNDWCIEPADAPEIEPEIVAVQAQILADILPLAEEMGLDEHIEEMELDDTQFLADEYEVEQALEGEHHDERLIKPDLSRYIKLDYTTASGKKGLVSPDVVSLTVLAGLLHPDQWYAKLIQIATDFDDLTAGRGKDKWEINLANLQQRYGKLNPGQIRMNIGNLIRGILKRHGEI